MRELAFEKEDRAQFHFAFDQSATGMAMQWATVGRVPLFGVWRPPAIKWDLPRDQLMGAVRKAVKTLPVAAQSEAEAAVNFVVDLMEQSAGCDLGVTFGDRKPDGKLDVTLEFSAQLPGGASSTLDPITWTPPIGEALDIISAASVALASAIPVPGAAAAVAWSFAVLKAALHVLKIA